MKKPIVVLLSLAIAGVASAQLVRTVEWYKTNAKERATVLAKCKDNPGELQATPSCINAQAAENQLKNARKGYAPLKPIRW